MREQLHLFDPARAPRAVWEFDCVDCGLDTCIAREYYIVRDDVWPLPARGGMLCIGCLEKRIGRELEPGDFIDCLVNKDRARDGSARLRARMRPQP